MTLAKQITKLRTDNGLSLDELATKARISKTYLWELERDQKGEIKPSAEVLLRIADGLSTTLAALLNLPTVSVGVHQVELPPSLQQFRQRMEQQHAPLKDEDLRDLALMRFRGAQPQTADEWHQLY